jgi:hypothetical protein
MAQAICRTLEDPPDRDFLRARAHAFSFGDSIARYEEILTGPLATAPETGVTPVERATRAPQLIQ